MTPVSASLSAELDPSFAKLAWLAIVDRDTGKVQAFHGSSVEVADDFMVEGVWDGDFATGAFHQAQHFFGSGVLIDDDGVWLVPSHALVDRILYCSHGRKVLASNSLPLLLAHTGARLDPAWNYREESYTSLKGIDRYRSRFQIVHPEIESFNQLFYRPLLIGKHSLELRADRAPQQFQGYESYIAALKTALDLIRANYLSKQRRRAVSAYTTISTGYDSTAVTALVRDFGIKAAFTSRRSNSSILPWMSKRAAVDDGTPIAKRFGVPVAYLEQPKNQISEDELYFLAPTSADAELVFYPMARHIERESESAVVFTGFHGDKLWDMHTEGSYLDTDIRRGDTSGLNLGEIRLKAGFINVAVPFMFARSIRDVVSISRSAEMSPWSVGGEYDRPIPRRLLEEAGVPRHEFGIRKKAVVQSYNYPVNRSLRTNYFNWLKSKHGRSRVSVYSFEKINIVLFVLARSAESILARFGLSFKLAQRKVLGKELDLPYELHYWALDRLTQHLPGARSRINHILAGAQPTIMLRTHDNPSEEREELSTDAGF